ncbi:ATP-binding protein [uncultured Clostridium sp.]|uniref:ATP-binding protein n=1 Tax=uncultured Clostridium sp. TaxID=59620 RepID=UPI0025873413|nr:ATP-binding protein [uncultured Clostridium sp.]MDU1348776.1 ATP-binding protein [Clostridium argentinense]
MGKIIGKIIATEKFPSTIDDFYFWTKQEMILNPFDVVKVNHIRNSISYGVVEEISHITDTANFLSDYISNDFGDVDSTDNTYRIGMNYVKVKVIGNSENIYIPLINNTQVQLANEDEVAEALGLKNVKNPVTCGYLEMYNGTSDSDRVILPVKMDSRFLIGPEGAHLNISGISGLAVKTSYSMFLLKAIQDQCINDELEEDIAFVLFNVKGKDLLALDEFNDFENEDEKIAIFELYKRLGMTPEPFKNVKYYYTYSCNKMGNTYLSKKTLEDQKCLNKALMYKYSYEDDKDNLDLMFASLDDPTQSMDSILNYIISNQGGFGRLDDWDDFLEEVQEKCKAGMQGDKEITVASWRKFNRIVRKSIYNNEIFGTVHGQDEIRMGEALKYIKKNEVHVIDIAKLNEEMQGFVFGNTIRTIYDLQLGQFNEEDNVNPPKKIVIFIDELNKYASQDTPKSSPILRQILDIAERGRSLGIILFSAEQFRSAIHSRVTGNCSTHAYGRTNAIEIAKSDYKYVPQVYKNMMTRLKQGEYIVQNPVFRSLLNIKFPKPIYKQYKQ